MLPMKLVEGCIILSSSQWRDILDIATLFLTLKRRICKLSATVYHHAMIIPNHVSFPIMYHCSPGFFLTHFTLASKLFSLAVQGSGALLSSNLEGALYKSP